MNNKEKFTLVSNLISDIFNLPVEVMDTKEKIEDFCKDHRAIEQQSWLAEEALTLILEKGNSSKLTFFEDILSVRIALFYYEGLPIIIGPYLQEEMTIGRCIQLCNSIDRRNMDGKDLLIYYGKFPVIPERHMNRIVRAILRRLELPDLEEHYVFYQGGEDDIEANIDLAKVSNSNIEMHYQTEREYMDAIKKGNIREALHYKKLLSENAAGMWTRKFKKEDMRLGFAVNRAMSRIAAYEAGVPAPIIHKITTKESSRISLAQSEKQMEEACQDMLIEFCEIIRNIKNEKYSAMVQSVIYYINQNYSEQFTVKDIADEIGISESYMISQFKKETNTTPAIFLRETRLKAAEGFLISTDEEIQLISGRVGIHDANYFVKIFKSKYGVTPKAYRKKYKI